jgi:hypothetical protein
VVLTAAIGELSARIEEQMRPFTHQLHQLVTMPGVGQSVAQVIVAETGADMTRFPAAANLASWAGVARGSTNRPASVAPARPATATYGYSARWESPRWLAARTKDTTYLRARYQHLAQRLGKKKAIVAIQHRSWSRYGTCLPTMSTTPISAATTSPDWIPKRPCAVSSANPTHSALPSASTDPGRLSTHTARCSATKTKSPWEPRFTHHFRASLYRVW